MVQDIPGKVSFTFDAWTSDPGDPFLSVTGHYIHAPPERPNAWKLRTKQLAFAPMEGRHSGANMANLLTRTVDCYGLHKKVGWFSCDNAASNDTCLVVFADTINTNKKSESDVQRWDPVQGHIRYAFASSFGAFITHSIPKMHGTHYQPCCGTFSHGCLTNIQPQTSKENQGGS